MVFKWTDEAVKIIRSVIKNNGSAQLAADELRIKLGIEISRNSVVGKCHRLGINLNSKNIVTRKKVVVEDEGMWRGKPIQYLIDAWNSGKNSSEIGDAYGTTRNIISKKARSLGLKPRSTAKIARENSIKSGIRTKPKKEIITEKPKPRNYTGFPNPDAIGVSFIDLERHHCRFPIGTGGDDPYRYCGATVPDGSSLPYCDVCRSVMYIPSKYQLARHVKE